MNPVVTFRCGQCRDGGRVIAGMFAVDGYPVIAWHRKNSVQKWGVATSARIDETWCFPEELIDGAPARPFGDLQLSGGDLPRFAREDRYQVACRRHGRFGFPRERLLDLWQEARSGGNSTVVLGLNRRTL